MKTFKILGGLMSLMLLFYSCDKNEYAPVMNNQVFSIEENSESGTEIGQIAASDRDEGQVLSYEITEGNEDGTFHLNSGTGMLSVADPSGLDFEENPQFTLTVVAADNHKKDPLESAAWIQINVLDILEITDGQAAYYSFDGNANDGSGNDLHGEVIGPLLSEDSKGEENSAYSFDGMDDYVSLGSDFDLPEKSISLLFFANTVPVYDYDLNPGSSWASLVTCDHPGLEFGSLRLGLSNFDGIDKLWCWKGSGLTANIQNLLSYEIEASLWYAITVTISEQEVKLYVNGTLAGSIPNDNFGHAVDGFAHMIVGSSRGANYRFLDGSVDEIYVHNRTLEDWEITDLHHLY